MVVQSISMDFIETIIFDKSRIGFPYDPVACHVVRAGKYSHSAIKPYWQGTSSSQSIEEETLDNAVKPDHVNVVGKYVLAALGALRRMNRVIAVISIDKREHYENLESVVQRTATDRLHCLDSDIERFET
jgi:hypothetical protein